MAITIGIALAVPEPWASQLQNLRRSYGDLQADRMPTHVTILPPHTVQLPDLPKVHDGLLAAARQSEPFQIVLSGAGTFRPISEVTFVNVTQGRQQCEKLESAVRSHINARPALHPYVPHVTAAMDVPADALDQAEHDLAQFHAQWLVDEVTLFHRDRAGFWSPDRSFVLG